MKIFGLCAVIVAATVCCNADPNIKVPAEVVECAKKNNADIDMLSKTKVDQSFIPTPEVKNFSECVYKKAGIMNEDGKLSKDFNESALAKQCKMTDGKDVTETVTKLMRCLASLDESQMHKYLEEPKNQNK